MGQEANVVLALRAVLARLRRRRVGALGAVRATGRQHICAWGVEVRLLRAGGNRAGSSSAKSPRWRWPRLTPDVAGARVEVAGRPVLAATTLSGSALAEPEVAAPQLDVLD